MVEAPIKYQLTIILKNGEVINREFENEKDRIKFCFDLATAINVGDRAFSSDSFVMRLDDFLFAKAASRQTSTN